MSSTTLSLFDNQDANIPWEDVCTSKDQQLSEADSWSVRRARLTSGPSAGVELVQLNNGALQVDIIPTRGMGIWRASYKGIPIGWNSPVKNLVHPQLVDLSSRNGLGWLDGFNELLVRCGLAFNGPPDKDEGQPSPVESDLTLHGKIANTPAHKCEVTFAPASPGTLSVTGVVDETSMFGPKLRLTSTVRTQAGSNGFDVVDEITNLGAAAAEVELLYHINIGEPFLANGSKIHCPFREIAPRDATAAAGADSFTRYQGPTAGYAEQVFYYNLLADEHDQTLVLLRTGDATRGVSVHFSVKELPCFSVWKCTQALADGYVTGLEPGTNYPNAKSYERQHGRVIKLAPGASYKATVRLEIHDHAASVDAVDERIKRLQGNNTTVVHRQPSRGYSPAGDE